MAYNLVPEEPTLIVILVYDGNSYTALEQDLAGQKFQEGRDVLTFVLRWLTLRVLMSYIYGAPILDVSRSHTTTQHSR